jgi:hypothetical protein
MVGGVLSHMRFQRPQFIFSEQIPNPRAPPQASLFG